MRFKHMYIISILLFVTGIFLLSYGYTMKKYSLRNSSKLAGEQVDLSTETNSVISDNIVPPNTKIKFYNVNNTNEKVFEFEVSGAKLSGKSKNDVEKLYCKGWYTLDNIKNGEILLVRTEPKIEKNKFIIGAKDGDLAIFTSDSSGKVKLHQKTEIKLNSVAEMKGNEEYLRKLVNGELLFNSAEEAEESLGDFE